MPKCGDIHFPAWKGTNDKKKNENRSKELSNYFLIIEKFTRRKKKHENVRESVDNKRTTIWFRNPQKKPSSFVFDAEQTKKC